MSLTYADTLTTEQRQFLDSAVAVAVNSVARLRDHADPEDVRSEVNVYLYGAGRKHIEKWLAADEKFRITRALCGVARTYAETEKAHRVGYSFDDLAWYSPEKLADIVPLALNSGWDGMTGQDEDQTASYGTTDGAEGGTLLAMVADVRRALGQAVDWAQPGDFDPLTEVGMERLVALADRLGGEWPDAPGYTRGRKVISNAAAVARTRNGWEA